MPKCNNLFYSKTPCYKGLCLNSNYSKDDLPISNATNEVQVDFELVEITDISDSTHSFSISAVLVVQWFEPRVTYNGSAPYFMMPKKFAHHFWRPDLYFWNAQNFKVHTFVDGRPVSELGFSGNGANPNLGYSLFFQAEIKCKMRFDDYPFDHHVCHLELTSYKHISSEIKLKVKYVKYLYQFGMSLSSLI